jgi:hypothetical protein
VDWWTIPMGDWRRSSSAQVCSINADWCSLAGVYRDHEEGWRFASPQVAQRRELTVLAPSAQAYELATLTGTQVLLLVVSETGIVRLFSSRATLSPAAR